MRKTNTKIDLRDNIEEHCTKCSHTGTGMCRGCFFYDLSFKDETLGGIENYNRAFQYLRIANVKGFKRDKPFGNYLNIQRKEPASASK